VGTPGTEAGHDYTKESQPFVEVKLRINIRYMRQVKYITESYLL
jgi:hypothetical protein